jgi:hypothetical protein
MVALTTIVVNSDPRARSAQVEPPREYSPGRLQALEAGGARRILNDYSFTNAPQLKRDPVGTNRSE